MRAFPSEFVWGTATAAYQIEGAVAEDGRGESIWDRFAHTPGTIANNETADIACDHYHRWQTDIALMRALGVNAYRFSIAWPRILPSGRGAVNERGIAFYDRLVDGLLEAGITPWVTLYHWDLPQALEDEGGWPNRETAAAFADYAEIVARRLGDRVKHWITLNEPWCSSILGYERGEHAPGKRSTPLALRAAHTLLLGHGMAARALRALWPEARVGITHILTPAYPASDAPLDLAAAARYDAAFNRWFLDPVLGRGYPGEMLAWWRHAVPRIASSDLDLIAAPIDFLGVNHYFPAIVAHDPADPYLRLRRITPPGAEVTAMGWVVQPRAFYDLLTRLHREYGPLDLVVTENGAAFPDPPPVAGRVADPARVRYLAGYLAEAARAIADGVPLRGYFVWSLLDNFEWAEGFAKRFGLYYTDYATQERTLKDSGRYYRAVIQAGAPLPADLPLP
ncbi:MAG: GH1 family beta-glucosidase [Chloroflexota bacterium]|nr:GH1 family beta-glucosidase [Dehalococcoidia bacterium]MDW8252914.1 GH1 family beta-glucosidase [Chloroflexota bacterium]